MTLEEQIAKAKEYNLGTSSRDEIISKVSDNLKSKFKFGPFDRNSEAGREAENRMIIKWATPDYKKFVAQGMDPKEAKKKAIRLAIAQAEQFANIKTYPFMIWTVCDCQIEDLVSKCVKDVETECSCKMKTFIFDARYSNAEGFQEIMTLANTSEHENIIVLVKNLIYASGQLYEEIRYALKCNSEAAFYMIQSSPLELSDGTNGCWDGGIGIPQSVLLSE